MLMYNLLDYSDNYCMTSGSLWNYYKVDIDGVYALQVKSFEYKTNETEKTPTTTTTIATTTTTIATIKSRWISTITSTTTTSSNL